MFRTSKWFLIFAVRRIKKIFSDTLHRGNSRLRSDRWERNARRFEDLLYDVRQRGTAFFHSVGCDESKISLTFPNSSRRDVHSYYLRCQRNYLIFRKEYSFELIHLNETELTFSRASYFLNVEYLITIVIKTYISV